MDDPSAVATFLFTDIEGSTRLWEEEPARMRAAMARHDALAREAVERHRGKVVKKTGDGLHAAFADPLDALSASVALQRALAALESESGLGLRARCGMHAGVFERRDDDYYGSDVNRAARIMGAAHGGQVLVSMAVAELVAGRLPQGLALSDLGSARLRDLARPERLYQVVAPELRRDFPPLRSLEATPNNLPHSLTSFIGRARELAEVEALVAERRLVTVTGMGGLGKTRLTLEVGARLLQRFSDGVWFVELAPLADGRWIAQAVATALGVKEEAGRPVVDALVRHLREREALLLLDNCEHVVEACADLSARVLAAAERTRILASSREPLRVAGEAAYPLASLSEGDEAVRLFVDRARAALPAFRASDANAPAIAAICRRLDGIPLALELAAARVRTLGVQVIAERLDDRFELLASGERNALPRQQTLRALIDWSYDLLAPPERALLRALSVFAGSWSIEAAEAVGAGSAVAETLGLLVEKSLVLLDPDSGRYRFLETVREYAREKLEAAQEAAPARDRHLAYFIALAERVKPELFGADQAAWLARLDLERENILAANDWCRHSRGDGAMALRLLRPVKHYWINRGLLELGHRLTLEALEAVPARDETRMRGLYDAGQLQLLMGRNADARETLEQSLAIAREMGDGRAVAALLQPLGIAALGEGDHATARRHLQEALALARARGDRRELGAALSALAQLHRADGQPQAARPLCEEALALYRALDDRESVAIGLLNLAMVSLLDARGVEAAAMLAEAAGIVEQQGSRRAMQSLVEACAGYAAFERDWEEAALLYGAAGAQARNTGLRRDAADEAFLSPRVAAARQALGDPRFAQHEHAGAALSHDEALARVRAWLQHRRGAGEPRAAEPTYR